MDILETHKLILFLILFIPGFISVKIYHLFVASDRFDFSQSFYEVVGYSCINFASFFWVIILIHNNNFNVNHQYIYFLIIGSLLFITPILWSIFFIWFTNLQRVKKYIISPVKGAWDFYFNSRKGCWIIVTLKNGKRIGGKFGRKSFASSYPRSEQIYLEEEWVLGNDDTFIQKKHERSNGILIIGNEIETLTFIN